MILGKEGGGEPITRDSSPSSSQKETELVDNESLDSI